MEDITARSVLEGACEFYNGLTNAKMTVEKRPEEPYFRVYPPDQPKEAKSMKGVDASSQ